MLFAAVTKPSEQATHPAPHPSLDGFVENQGACIHFEEFGEKSPGKPVLILLHGNGEDSHIFDRHIPFYTPYYRVITVDTRGCGESTRGDGELNFSLLADDLFALMNELHIGQAILLGFSDGGNTAIHFTLSHQERVIALILVGANLFPSGMTTGARIASGATERFANVGKVFSKKAKAVHEEVSLMTNQPRIDPLQLTRIRIPALVIAGENDMIKREHTQLIADSLPDARMEIIEGASHFVMKDAPDEFARVTTEWLLEDD